MLHPTGTMQRQRLRDKVLASLHALACTGGMSRGLAPGECPRSAAAPPWG